MERMSRQAGPGILAAGAEAAAIIIGVTNMAVRKAVGKGGRWRYPGKLRLGR